VHYFVDNTGTGFAVLITSRHLTRNSVKLAAIDIGSNAARLQISSVLEYAGNVAFKKVEYVRFALRLGHDVFTTQQISPESEARFVKLLHCFKLLIELHEVEEYRIYATSAMREAKNASDIVDRVQLTLGMKIQVIDGRKEAELISRVVRQALTDDHPHLHIDVGGGSTELNLYVNRQKVAAQSFRIGSVRQLEQTESPTEWKKLKRWLEENLPAPTDDQPTLAVGTGGNISKIYEMANHQFPAIPWEDIDRVKSYIASLSLEERVNRLQLNPDRADVIVPAAEIYLTVMRWANAYEMLVPNLGLKDGMLEFLYEKRSRKKSDNL
jgi:exopolyphosphatase / guanosine-5'-triphosphate,3'-diphosphate pyrophosphatase